MKNRILNILQTVTTSVIIAEGLSAQGTTPTFRAVEDVSYIGHQNVDYAWFGSEAPANWDNFITGPSGSTEVSVPYYLSFSLVNFNGLNWPAIDVTDAGAPSTDFIIAAITNDFDLAYMYGDGTEAPGVVYNGLQTGCAFITKYGWANFAGPCDYRVAGEGSTTAILGVGPTPAMTVSGGQINETTPQNQWGPQLEFIDFGGGGAQSYVFGQTAAKYATLKSANPTWNVFDVRQALRQTCTHYASGWSEQFGYGYLQVLTPYYPDLSVTTQPSLPTEALDLDAGPPLQFVPLPTAGGTQVAMSWYNFLQTAYVSTVVMVNGQTIYDGTGSSFVWTPTFSGIVLFQSYTKIYNGTAYALSKNTAYSQYPYATVPITETATRNTPVDLAVLASDTTGELSLTPGSLSTVPYGTCTINSDGKTIHFVPSPEFLGTLSFTFKTTVTTTGGTYPLDVPITVTVTVVPNSADQPPSIVLGPTASQTVTLTEGQGINIPFTVSDELTPTTNLIQSLAWSDSYVSCQVFGIGNNRVLQIIGNSPVSGTVVDLSMTDWDLQSTATRFNVTVLPDPTKPVRPVLSGAAYSSSGGTAGFSFNVSGPAGRVWDVYSSPDLKNWTTAGTVALSGTGLGSFTDNSVYGLNGRFYYLSDGIYASKTIGFERVLCQPGWSAIVNQLDGLNNTLNGLFGNLEAANGTPMASLPDGIVIQDQNNSQDDVSNYTWHQTTQQWVPNGDAAASPGQGIYLNNPTGGAFTVTFVGLVRDGAQPVPLAAEAIYVLGSILPEAGGLQTVLGYIPSQGDFTPGWGDAVEEWDYAAQNWSPYEFSTSTQTWDPNEPVIGLGEAFGIEPAANNSWVENYSPGSGIVTEPPKVNQPVFGAGVFTFTVYGLPNATWPVYVSSDLANWSLAGTVALSGTGSGVFEDKTIQGVNNRYYKLSNGAYNSHTIGFEQFVCQPGISMIADQLDTANETLGGVFTCIQTANGTFLPSLPNGTIIYQQSGTGTVPYTWNQVSGQWSGITTLSPGQGAFIDNPTTSSFTVTFVGVVREGQSSISMAAGGNYLVSSTLPETGGIQTVLGYVPQAGDSISKWNYATQNWTPYTYYTKLPRGLQGPPSGWINAGVIGEPVIGIGEAFYIQPVANNIWSENYSAENGTATAPPSLSQPVFGASSFTFAANGPAGSAWSVYSSGDLNNWTQIGSVTLNANGASSYTDNAIQGVPYRFYKLSDGVYTSHTIGFERIVCPPGMSAIANQLDKPNESLSGVFQYIQGANGSFMPSLPDGTVLYEQNGTGYNDYAWEQASNEWTTNGTFSPGEGAFIDNPTSSSFTVTFVGLVREGQSAISLTGNTESFVSSILPEAGGVQTALGYVPQPGDTVDIWNQGVWNVYTYYTTPPHPRGTPTPPPGWAMGSTVVEPVINVGESFYILPVANNIWTENYLSAP